MHTKYPVFIVVGDKSLRRLLVDSLRQERCRPTPFATGADFLDALEFLEPGVALVDLQLPDIAGMSVLERLHSHRRDVACIMTGANADIQIAVQAIKQGADDFLEQPFVKGSVCATIREVAAQLRERISSEERRRSASSCINKLSKRELDVFRQFEIDHDNQTVAEKLHMSVRTVEKYRSTIMKKCGTRSFFEALLLCGSAHGDDASSCEDMPRCNPPAQSDHPS